MASYFKPGDIFTNDKTQPVFCVLDTHMTGVGEGALLSVKTHYYENGLQEWFSSNVVEDAIIKFGLTKVQSEADIFETNGEKFELLVGKTYSSSQVKLSYVIDKEVLVFDDSMYFKNGFLVRELKEDSVTEMAISESALRKLLGRFCDVGNETAKDEANGEEQ